MSTHEVQNQPPRLGAFDAYRHDAALSRAVEAFGGAWAAERLETVGRWVNDPAMTELADSANRFAPVLKTHDRYGNRIDEVEFHPSWHRLLEHAKSQELHGFPWNHAREGAFVVRSALFFLFSQIENGVLCPISMTFSGVPVLARQPGLAESWIPRLTRPVHDPRPMAPEGKDGCLMGMAMTEKQGGSDVRANSTRARPVGRTEPGAEYRLTGHKWFCSAPMSDAFLTLAQTEAGISCFFVPRWMPDGTRNPFHLQRLKDKLGNKANASSEVEYDDTRAWLVGEPGRGVPTIIEMVNHTRLDCAVGSAGIIRRAVTEALHHAAHRKAFGRRLAEHPLMLNVLADLALESEAATLMAMRVARGFDEARLDEARRPFVRLLTAIAKYWVCKTTPIATAEALECLGGNGYVEESGLPRFHREAPLNSIWEGSGNVICLDVLRTLDKEPESFETLRAWVAPHRAAESRIEQKMKQVEGYLKDPVSAPMAARSIVGGLAQVVQAVLLRELAPAVVADAFVASRFGEGAGRPFGMLPPGTNVTSIVERASPPAA